MNLLIKLYPFILALLLSLHATGQDSCRNSLYEANRLYESGRIKECTERLEPCLNSIKDREALTESYHLLSLAYYNLGNETKAGEFIVKLLKTKPDYQKYPNIDPLDFSRHVNSYTVREKLYVGAFAGFNINSIALKKSYSVYPSLQRYNPSAGLQTGVLADYRIRHELRVSGAISFARISIDHVIDSAGSWSQQYYEAQNYVSIDLCAAKHFRIYQKLHTFAGLGFGLNYLGSGNISLDATNQETQTIQQATKDGTPERIRAQPAITLSAGFSYPVAIGELCLSGSFSYFLRNTVNPDKRFEDINFIFNNQYVSDDIRLRPVLINIQYKIPVLWKVEKNK